MKYSSNHIHFILVALFIMHPVLLNAQREYTVSGLLQDNNTQAVKFANVALLSSADSSIIAGTVTGDDGRFELKYNQQGTYLLLTSFVGYFPFHEKIELSDKQKVDLGTIIMKAKQIELEDVVITKERMKAKQQLDKTTYYVNSAMRSTSNTGIDMMQHIPGVQVDLLQNISLNGSRKIIFLVDGIERDASYLAQITAENIDRVDIKDAPGVEYDAEVSGVINVILKQDENTGINGHVYATIPTANDEVFSFPSASLNYSFDKLTLYSSYNGGFSFFDIETEDKRSFSQENNSLEIIKNEKLYQQNWSHKVHFGADYIYNEKNQFNIYGFISRFSNEQSGSFHLRKSINDPEDQSLHYIKDDYDINTSAYSSFFYKHLFTEGTELSVDANYYMLRSENRLNLKEEDSENEQLSHSQPRNNFLKTRIDLSFPLNENISINTGIEQRLDHSDDLLFTGFNYTESTSAAYFSADYTKNKWQASTGMRAEYLQYLNETAGENKMHIMPALHIKYSFSDKKHLKFSYRKGIQRPSVFQLNPNLQTLDIYASKKGNPALSPAIDHNIKLDYSLVFGNSFLKTGLFYEYNQNVIEILTLMKEDSYLEKEVHNAGDISRTGIRTSGSFKLHKNISINPDIRVFHVQTYGNDLARVHHIENKQALNFESSLSGILRLKHNISFSFSAQYMSRQTHIQNDYHEDALYFISLEKTFFDRLKAGITSAIPFSKTFTYRGYDISGRNFSQSIEDNIQISVFPVWFNLSYTFASGKKTQRIERRSSFKENIPEKGF